MGRGSREAPTGRAAPHRSRRNADGGASRRSTCGLRNSQPEHLALRGALEVARRHGDGALVRVDDRACPDEEPGQEQADASANSQSEAEQQQGGTQQASQGKSEGRSNNQPNSPDGKSGIGKQDGDKAAREAAELAAMGKLSEIIGKRAANITGEVMVEVSSGKQQLKTQYSDRNGAHAESGGEINRDEVPLAYQQYVQQYFAQMRKLPAGKSKGAPDSKSSATPDAKLKPGPASLP